ncbi:MAG: DUF177 domain-containing protein [Proteobacteria bacterium]|nr:DUF177 domain-containing protein [Pseudomonadota bacterium]
MKTAFDPAHLDIAAFAQAGGQLAAHDTLQKYKRLMQEAHGLGADLPVNWRAQGEWRAGSGAGAQPWLHLEADAVVPLTCQRCLGRVDVPLAVDRVFRFVADEDTAAAEDEISEEDVLVQSHGFDLRALVEDELLLALPLVPMHEACPTPVKLSARDAAFDEAEAADPGPFAALERLKRDKPN